MYISVGDNFKPLSLYTQNGFCVLPRCRVTISSRGRRRFVANQPAAGISFLLMESGVDVAELKLPMMV